MKSIWMAAVAVSGLLAVAPASAQGVKIGILNDQSGVYADYGGKYSVEAARMAIEDFGDEVLGKKIEMVTADHQNKPDLATAIARRWLDEENTAPAKAYTILSAGLGYRVAHSELRFDARNLNNSRAPVSLSELGDGQVYLMPARSLEVSYRYWF